jgi:hypothetical protein
MPTLSCTYRQWGPYFPQGTIDEDTVVDGSVWIGLRTYFVQKAR